MAAISLIDQLITFFSKNSDGKIVPTDPNGYDLCDDLIRYKQVLIVECTDCHISKSTKPHKSSNTNADPKASDNTEIKRKEMTACNIDSVPGDRKCINFMLHHVLRSTRIINIRTILSDDYKLPQAIINILIELIVPAYFKSFCKISLTFQQNNGDVLYALKKPLLPTNYDSNTRLNISSLIMGGTIDNIPEINVDGPGGARWYNWGQNTFQEATCKLHSYSDIEKQYIDKDNTDEVNMTFNMNLFDFKNDEVMFESSNDNHGSNHPFNGNHGDCIILCVDYTHWKSLLFAEKYAERFMESGKMICFVITTKSAKHEDVNETKYFTFDDVVELAAKYDASAFEIPGNGIDDDSDELPCDVIDDDNCMFVYSQILMECVNITK